MNILNKILNRCTRSQQKKIKVRMPSMTGDKSRLMTVQELQKEYKDYLIIDPSVGDHVDIRKLAELDIDEVIAIPPITGGQSL